MMPFTISLVAVAIIAAGGMSFVEWRRPTRRHLLARVVATGLAIVTLALLGLRPTWRHAPSPAGLRADLWTPLISRGETSAASPDALRFALPDAHLDSTAQPVPDIGFLRRHYPAVGTLRILGDGLDPADLDALQGWHVEFEPPKSVAAGLSFLRCPRDLKLGDPLIVQGQLQGLTPGATRRLILEAPDGAVVQADTLPADANGESAFTLRAAPLPSTGHFLWHLRGAGADLPLGVDVVRADLPRLLVLESAPRFDTAALRRWFGAAGGTVLARTQLGRDRYQYTDASVATPPPFAALDGALLAGFDLLLAEAGTLLTLPPAERDALLAAVANTGLGVLVLPDDTLSGTHDRVTSPLVPWTLSPLATDPPGADRPARVQWAGQSFPTDLPLPTAPFEITALGAAERVLVSDGQGHPLAASVSRGRGQIALTLVRDTTRWQRENDPAAFAAYWSFLFSRLARPASVTDAGRWSLPGGEAGPVFVDHPLTLVWTGPAAHPSPGPASVTPPPGTGQPAALALAADPAEPGCWRGTFWPRQAGWHRVALPSGSGSTLDFYVDAADAWPILAAHRRQVATARFAESSVLMSPASMALPPTREEIPPLWFAALFFLSAGYLWIERRFAH